MRCDQCGAAYDPQDHFCRNCGVQLNSAPAGLLGAGMPAPDVTARRIKTKKRLRAATAGFVIIALMALIAAQLLPDLISISLGGKPKDLGVAFCDADYQSILKKTQIEADDPPTGEDRRNYTDQFSGAEPIDWTFTDSELTAWFNLDKQPGYWPFELVQMKLDADNVIEASMAINPVKLMTFDCVTSYLPREIQSFMNGLSESIPVYAKAKITFTAPKQVHIEMLDFQAAGLPVSSMGTSEQANQMLETILNATFGAIDQVNIELFTTNEGSLHMKGTWYSKINRVPAKQE